METIRSIRSNGNLELVAFRIVLPGRLGRCRKNTHDTKALLLPVPRTPKMGSVTARREPARDPGDKGSAFLEAPCYTALQ